MNSLFHAFLVAILCLASVVAGAAKNDDASGHLLAAGVVQVATQAELAGTNFHKDMLARGVDEASIVDGVLVVARMLCCRDNPKTSIAVYAYNPLAIQVAPGDLIELRVGDSQAKGTVDELVIVTRVLQRADQVDGMCRWDPPDPRLWLRFVYCDWMPAEGWVKRNRKLYPGWYKPAAVTPGD